MTEIRHDRITKIARRYMLPGLTADMIKEPVFWRLQRERLERMTPEERAQLDREVAQRKLEEHERRMELPVAELIRESGLASDEMDDNTVELLKLLDAHGWEIVRKSDD